MVSQVTPHVDRLSHYSSKGTKDTVTPIQSTESTSFSKETYPPDMQIIRNSLRTRGISQVILQSWSIRSSSTSAAAKAKVPLDTILRTADWSGHCMFAKYYQKPIYKSGEQATALLNSQCIFIGIKCFLLCFATLSCLCAHIYWLSTSHGIPSLSDDKIELRLKHDLPVS